MMNLHIWGSCNMLGAHRELKTYRTQMEDECRQRRGNDARGRRGFVLMQPSQAKVRAESPTRRT